MYSTLGNCARFKIPPPIVDYESVVIEDIACDNIHDPRIWGPPWWFSLFSGCTSVDEVIPRADRGKYWKFIEGLPFMLPCKICRKHAKVYVEKHRGQKDQICSSRHNLVKFFVEFHNSVSRRKGQATLTVREVEQRFMGDGPVNAIRIRYGQ